MEDLSYLFYSAGSKPVEEQPEMFLYERWETVRE